MRALFTWIKWGLLIARQRAWTARRQHRGVAFLLYTAIAALGDLVAVTIALSFVLGLLAAGATSAALLVALIAIVLVVPGPLAERVAIPRGYHRFAYALVQIDELGRAGADQPARLAAARAAARVGSPPEAAAWITSRRPGRLDATEVAVQAILAHGRGDRDDARGLFNTVAAFADPAPEARELAAEWLALDDAARGAWAALVARGLARAFPARGAHRTPASIRGGDAVGSEGGEPLWPATSMTYLLEGVGARLLGKPGAPSALGLWVRWLEAPARRATWPLVRRALAAPARSAATADSTAAPAPSTATSSPALPKPPPPHDESAARVALAHALHAHGAALRDGTVDAVAAAALAWDATVKTPALAIAVARRAIALGCPADAGDRAMAELDEQVIRELATLIEQRALPLPALHARAPGSALLGAIAGRARRELLTRLELTCDRIGDRTHDQRSIDAVDELRTFVAVRRAYDDAAAQGGSELERLAFPHVHTELLNWTVWLWNDRKEYFLSHVITCWLYERALAVGDAEAVELHGSNGAIRIPGV